MSGTPSRMRVLGIDPGSYATGWGLLGGSAARPVVIDFGLIRLPRRETFAVRLDRLHRAVLELLERETPEVACVEAPFHGVNPRAALQLAHARGVVLAAAAAAGVEVVELAPAAVKRAVVGHGTADKAQVKSMIERLLRPPRAIPCTDVSDALAVAYCHVSGAGMQDAVRRAVEAERGGGTKPSRRRPPRTRSR